MVHVLWKPVLENFEHYFASVWDEYNCVVVWTFIGIYFLWDWNENWSFPVLWPQLSFPNWLACWLQHFHNNIFQDLKELNWNSITSTSFVLLRPSWLPIPGCLTVWVITLSWLSGSWRSFSYCSSVYSCHLFLISSASFRSIPFLSFIMSIFVWNVPLISQIFMKRSLGFPILSCLYFFPLITEEGCLILSLLFGTLHSIGYIFPFLLCLSPPFFSQLHVVLPQTSIFPFCMFFWGGRSWSLPPCTMSWNSIHSSSGTLSNLIPWIYLSLPLYNCKVFHLGHTWMF